MFCLQRISAFQLLNQIAWMCQIQPMDCHTTFTSLQTMTKVSELRRVWVWFLSERFHVRSARLHWTMTHSLWGKSCLVIQNTMLVTNYCSDRSCSYISLTHTANEIIRRVVERLAVPVETLGFDNETDMVANLSSIQPSNTQTCFARGVGDWLPSHCLLLQYVI